MHKRVKVKAMDTLAERHTAQMMQAEVKVEQKNTDERSARSHYKEDD